MVNANGSPVGEASVVDVAVAALRSLIMERPYRAGDRLPPERELSALLGVSRPTLRRAIGRLADDGAIVARQGSGTFIAAVDLSNIFELRLQLEPFAAERAATRRSRTDLTNLTRSLSALRLALDDPQEFAKLDARLHAQVAASTHNPILEDTLVRLEELVKLSREVTSLERAVRVKTLRHLHILVSAIRRGDPSEAAEAMRNHIEHIFLAATHSVHR